MSMQSDLDEFDSSGPRNPANSGRGIPVADRADRQKCGYEDTKRGSPCTLPVTPGRSRCQRHLNADKTDERGPEQDHSYLLSVTKAPGDSVAATEEVRCPNGHPIPAMYRPMCPECGHRRED